MYEKELKVQIKKKRQEISLLQNIQSKFNIELLKGYHTFSGQGQKRIQDMMRSINSNRQLRANTSSQQSEKSKKLGLTSSNSKNKNLSSTSVASMTSSLKKSTNYELKSSGRKFAHHGGSSNNSNSNKSLKGVKQVMSNPVYQQLKRQEMIQNKQNAMEKKTVGTIPVKNIKQRICGVGLKEDVNSSSNNNIMGNHNIGNNNNNSTKLHQQQSSMISAHTKKFTQLLHHQQGTKQRSTQKQGLYMGIGNSSNHNMMGKQHYHYMNNNSNNVSNSSTSKDNKMTIKTRGEGNNNNYNPSMMNNINIKSNHNISNLSSSNSSNDLLNFTSALHTQQCEDGLNSNKIMRQSIQSTLSLDQFELGRKLGKGRFGDVFMARELKSGFALAIKIINKKELKESQMEKQLIQEIKIQMYSNHPNILKMYGFFSDKNKIYLLLELATNGCLFKEIRKKSYLPENLSSFYFRQVTSGVRYLHSNSVIHRDIKPENILNCFNVLKLCDFGWAIYSPIYQRQTFCGTLDYVPPEIVTGEFYDEKADVWCLGVLCYELCTGKAPFQSTTDQNETYDKILKVNIEFPIYLSPQIVDFIGKILTRDPSKRLGLQEVEAHEWMRMYENEAGRMISKQIWDRWIELTKTC